MELYLRVRLAVSEGMTQRQAAKHFNISRDSVAKMVSYSTPPGYQRRTPIRRPKLDAFVSMIEQWLDADMEMPRKQRHTAKRVPCRASGILPTGEISPAHCGLRSS